ncbi:MAG: hypothetical protein MUP92_03425, partial [Actinobacteria bacterium]|nr:hypothetical protein [Actinomycetota bacterium]
MLIGVAVAVATAAIVGALVLVLSPDSRAESTRAQYFARVAEICQVYGPKLDRIPPPDASGTGDVVAAIRTAIRTRMMFIPIIMMLVVTSSCLTSVIIQCFGNIRHEII